MSQFSRSYLLQVDVGVDDLPHGLLGQRCVVLQEGGERLVVAEEVLQLEPCGRGSHAVFSLQTNPPPHRREPESPRHAKDIGRTEKDSLSDSPLARGCIAHIINAFLYL